LNAALSNAGSEFLIERALPAGAQPVKTVVFDDANAPEERQTEAPRRREKGL
jgi:hypothetical protein